MRLFLAIDLPEPVKEQLSQRARASRSSLPKARWVRQETMHITLAFLGETPLDQVDAVHRALIPVCATWPRMRGRLGGGGAFPPRGRASVLWSSVEVVGDLVGLHRDLEQALSSIDDGAVYRPEKRAFTPHVTQVRARPPWKRADADRWIEAFGQSDLEFPIDAVTLFESQLSPSGPRYTVRAEYPLARKGDESALSIQ